MSSPPTAPKVVLTCHPVAQNELVDNEMYLVQTKHGMIQGRWSARDEYFQAYFWQDIS